jgi:hypothetical protein
MMTADEIRGATFPRRLLGYGSYLVNNWLSIIAFALDAGFSPPPVTPKDFPRDFGGYDKQAVDRFFDTLASDRARGYGQLVACPWPLTSEDPALGDNSGARTRPARLPRAARRQYAQDCDAGWLSFSGLPGTHLHCTWGWRRYPPKQIVSSDGQVLLTRRGGAWTVAATRQVVDAGTGRPILQTIGNHTPRNAGTVVLCLEQRWFRFPVKGSRLSNAVMTAVDEADTEVLWFRTTGRQVADVVVSPECDLTPELLCVIELMASSLEEYFVPQGGGGG